MEDKKTIKLLRLYLDSISIVNYDISESDDSLGHLIVLKISKDDPRIGILLGVGGTHLYNLKRVLRVVGAVESLRPCLVLKLI